MVRSPSGDGRNPRRGISLYRKDPLSIAHKLEQHALGIHLPVRPFVSLSGPVPLFIKPRYLAYIKTFAAKCSFLAVVNKPGGQSYHRASTETEGPKKTPAIIWSDFGSFYSFGEMLSSPCVDLNS